MLKHITILFLFLSLAFPATAQKKLPLGPALSPRQGKILHQLDKTLSSISYAPHATRPASASQCRVVGTAMQLAVLPPSTAPIPVLSDEGVSLSDGRTEGKENHSIVPSAVTVLGSPAIARGQDRTITFLRDLARSTSTAEYIPPTERERWKAEFEALRALWIKAEPSDLQNLSNYLTHPVPPATLSYLQREYASLTEQILLA